MSEQATSRQPEPGEGKQQAYDRDGRQGGEHQRSAEDQQDSAQVQQQADQQSGQQSLEPSRDRWRALAICLLAGAMTLLDVSIVNVALPTLQRGLRADESDIQWIVAGYSLSFGVALVPTGRLGDARSRRAVFLLGVAVFTVSSAACGTALNPAWLVVSRIVQGFGGGMIAPQISGFIQNLFRGPERGQAFGMFGAVVGFATAVGPLLGGVLVALGGTTYGWRLVFFVNVPVGIAVILLGRRLLPDDRRGKHQSLDPLGVVLFAAALVFVLWPLVSGQQRTPLEQRPWGYLAPAAALLLAFFVWERHWRRRQKETLVELPLLKVGSYMLGLGLGTFYFAGFTAIFLISTLFLQNGLHYSALEAGATVTPFAIGSAVSAWWSGRLVQRFGRLLAVVGVVMVAGGIVAIDLLVPHLSSDVGLKLLPAYLVAGLGSGLVISPNVTLTLSEVDPAQSSAGGGMLQTVQRVGSAVGIAVVLAQYFSRLLSSHGNFVEAFSVSLRTTLGFLALALAMAGVDLVRRRSSSPPPEHADGLAQPRHAAS